MANSFDPVSRLWRIGSLLLPEFGSGGASSKRLGEALCEVIGLETNENGRFSLITKLNAFTYLVNLVIEAESYIAEHSPNEVIHKVSTAQLRSIMSALSKAHINSEVSTLHGTFINQDALDQLHTTAFSFERYANVREIPAEKLDILANKIMQAIEFIKSLEIDSEVKQWYLKILLELHKSIVEYKISGSEGIEQSLLYSMGALVMYRQNLVSEESQQKSALEKIWAVMNDANALLDMAGKVKEHWPALVSVASAAYSILK